MTCGVMQFGHSQRHSDSNCDSLTACWKLIVKSICPDTVMRGADASMTDGESSSALERQVRLVRSTVQFASLDLFASLVCIWLPILPFMRFCS